MAILNSVLAEPTSTVLGRAIQHIGIGKNGSKPLPADLLAECRRVLLANEVDSLQKGAFIGALLAKGPTDEERTLEDIWGKGAFSHPMFLINKVCPGLPSNLFPIATKLLRGHNLGLSEAYQLGKFLFAEEESEEASCEAFRAMAVSILRVRHETNDEYKGLYMATMETLSPGFQQVSCVTKPLIQLAEPFDGVNHSYMITPLLAQFFSQRDYGVVSMVSRTPGPKYTLNAYDLFLHLGCHLLQSNHELAIPAEPYGWVLDQKALSPALDRWIDRRRVLIKRPFLSTLEKLLNPCGARILVTSVFHITYQMKMAELALMAGFDAAIVLKRGLEGSLAPSTNRASGILCAVRTPQGHLFFQHFDADLPAFAEYRNDSDEEVISPYAHDNARLIREFLADGKSANADFDNRVRFAKALFGRGLDWIEGQLQ
ncbi:anthranilate phosphoribosyltransferase [Tellurirhabdus bombi]|uniref:anthranilate phosphoribosyltransferase n=1 Tax=Tellurirhabdus bombi TaxID=2907205 RepID=UPI001F29FCA0|nr:anthranilate phosphoribosyltransferase [Tellurirhabdus bombi]